MLPLFWVGHKRDLNVDDLCKPLKEHESNLLGNKFARVWEGECKKANVRKKIKAIKEDISIANISSIKPSLLKVICRCYGLQLYAYGIILAILELGLK